MGVSFEELGLNEQSLAAVRLKGFRCPTPIQAAAIPRLLAGDANIIAKARTGTGKTAAFGLPLIQELGSPCEHPGALVLVPTRELTAQVASELSSLRIQKIPRIHTVYGGVSIAEQLRNLEQGGEIIVGTTGRVIDHIERGSLELSYLRYFILDEADEMLNMGFVEDIESIFSHANKDARVLMFSATMPRQILSIASTFMGSYEVVEEVTPEEARPLIEQFMWVVRDADKIEALVRLIDVSDNFYGLVFCQTKADADTVAKSLDERHYHVAALHGDIPQSQREKILERFRTKRARILVATDVAARGIDIEGITHVVNYSIPHDSATYTHRVGRTGRAGSQGIAISFVRPHETRRMEYLSKHCNGELKASTVPLVEHILTQKEGRIFSSLKTHLCQLLSEGVHGTFTRFAQRLLQEDLKARVAEALGTSADVPQEPNVSLVAALLQIHYGTALDPRQYRDIKTITPETARARPHDAEKAYVRIEYGKKSYLTRKRVVQFICALVKIPGHLVDRVDITERCAFARIPRRAAEEAVRLSKKRKDLPRVSFVGHASRLRNTATPAEKSTYPRRLPSGEGLREQISRRTSSSKKASGKPEDSLPPPQEHRLD